ncbi:sensor histidine kinase [Modicisalibacter luteus]|uniref:sensor histidine kinase n=1 Tax=Modicisalibacter luteus TaxID=453962 RepID=UPI0036283B60
MRNYEDDFALDDLLSPAHQARLLELLGKLSGASFALNAHDDGASRPLEFNLDTLGWLKAELPAEQHQAAVRLYELVLFYAGKYRLAANLHHDATEASYLELQQKHAAVQASEEKYKQLAQRLTQQVEEQVRVIKKAQQELYESARLRAVGQLAAGIAHEINTPIGFIGSNLRVANDYLDELEASLPDSHETAMLFEDFHALLDESSSGTKRIARIVSDLKTFSNIDQADFAACDINALITTACRLIQAEQNQVLPLSLRLGELPEVAGYPAKLSQAFYNVLDNATKSLEAGGQIRVASRVQDNALEVLIEDEGVVCLTTFSRAPSSHFLPRETSVPAAAWG